MRLARLALAAALWSLGGLTVLGSLGLPSRALAQPHSGSAVGPAAPVGPGEPSATPPAPLERREQIKKKIRSIRAYALIDELALDERTAGKLFTVLARYDDETDRLLEQRVELQRRLRRAGAMKDGRAIDRLIDDAVANQRGFWDLEDKRVTEMRRILTPVQAAKLLVALPALERRIQNQLRRAIAQRRSGASEPSDDDPQPDELDPRQRPRPARGRREAPLAPRAQPSNAPGNTPPCGPSGEPCR
jgi:hypothetical protein